jgi:hypothetical protein
MSRIVKVILIYHHRKPIDLISIYDVLKVLDRTKQFLLKELKSKKQNI